METNKNKEVELPWDEWIKTVESDHLKANHLINRMEINESATYEEAGEAIKVLVSINQYIPHLIKACETYSSNIDDLLISNTRLGMIIDHLKEK